MLISQLEVCQEEGVKNKGTWRTFRVFDRRVDDRVIPDVMNDVFLLQGRYPGSLKWICHDHLGR